MVRQIMVEELQGEHRKVTSNHPVSSRKWPFFQLRYTHRLVLCRGKYEVYIRVVRYYRVTMMKCTQLHQVTHTIRVSLGSDPLRCRSFMLPISKNLVLEMLPLSGLTVGILFRKCRLCHRVFASTRIHRPAIVCDLCKMEPIYSWACIGPPNLFHSFLSCCCLTIFLSFPFEQTSTLDYFSHNSCPCYFPCSDACSEYL